MKLLHKQEWIYVDRIDCRNRHSWDFGRNCITLIYQCFK